MVGVSVPDKPPRGQRVTYHHPTPVPGGVVVCVPGFPLTVSKLGRTVRLNRGLDGSRSRDPAPPDE